MAATDVLYVFLWTLTIVTSGLTCPEICSCSDKYGRHVAECSYKEITVVPRGFPSNVSTVSLSANRIGLVPAGSFENVTQVTSLWMAHNEIVSIEPGTIAPLVHLRNFDISHNRIAHFPWEDLENLTSLHLLKMNHNRMSHLPTDAFANLKDLRSLRLNNNRFTTITEGTLDGLLSLSHLQIYNNPFACTCSLDWLRDWISTTTISVAEQKLIVCESPERLKGEVIGEFPESKCSSPNVTIRTDSQNSTEGNSLVLTCVFTGNPKPLVMWSIRSRNRNQELALAFTEEDSAESNEESPVLHQSLKVFNNGTLVIPHLRKEDGGNYSCSATNEVGRAEDAVEVDVKVVASSKTATMAPLTTRPTYTQTLPMRRQMEKVFVSDSVPKELAPTGAPDELTSSQLYDTETKTHTGSSKCGLTTSTKLISSHVFSGSLDDVKQYTFDFGVIALGVSETEATVRLNPLLILREKIANQAAEVASSESRDLSDISESASSDGLYLCVTADRKHAAVQWSRIKDGVNTYLFKGLRPATNYSLCLTYRGDDCEVQVLFTTRRRVPNLLIIISVSVCLLTVSTVPLLGATCFHLVYMYRGKTYKLILKAKDQYQAERNLTVNFNIQVPLTDSQRKINGSQLDEEDEEEEEEEESESMDGVREADTEESVVTESVTMSQCRGNLDDCEVGSEYSDRLPLGAEAVNITNNYKYPNQ